MRAIKFRGKRVCDGQWTYWEVCQSPMPVIPETVGQFTGLQDKDGNDIYEGDVFITHFGGFSVEWNACHNKMEKGISSESYICGFIRRYKDGSVGTLADYTARDLSVAGNIHDNPELLR